MKTVKIQGVRARLEPTYDLNSNAGNRKQRRALKSKRKGSRKRSIADIANIRLKGGEGKS